MKIIDQGIPQATDYFGILWTLAGIKDCIIVEHGAPGTITYTHIGFSSMDRRSMFHKIFSSAVNENDVIMGTDTRLCQAVKWVDSTYHPSAIAVVATAITAVIGLDIDGFVCSLQPEINARLISFPSGGFHGTYLTGIAEGSVSLIREFIRVTPKDPEKNTVNIIGPTCEQFNTSSDITEIRRILSSIGISIRTVFPESSSIKDIETIPDASLNLLTRDVMIPVGNIIHEICSQDYYYGLPFGITGTINWISDITKRLDLPYPESFISKEKERWGYNLDTLLSKMQPYNHLKIVIAAPYEYAIGLAELITREWGMSVSAVILPDTPRTKTCDKYFSNLNIRDILINPSDNDFQTILNQKKPHILFANTYQLKMGRNVPIKIHAAHPTPDILTLFDGTPYVGFRGYAYLTQRIVNEMQSHPEVFYK